MLYSFNEDLFIMRRLRLWFLVIFLGTLFSNAFAHVLLETKLTDSIYEPGDMISLSWSVVIEHDPVDWDLYYSTDGGESWEVIEEGIRLEILTYEWTAPDVESSRVMVQIVQDNEVMGDYSDYSDTFSITKEQLTAIGEIDETRFQLKFFPNPAVSQVDIHLTLISLSEIALSVHSPDGSLVETLVKSTLPSGNHHFLWSCDNKPAAVYFLRINVAGVIRTKPIYLVH